MHDHADRSEGLAANAEDALHERDVGFDAQPSPGMTSTTWPGEIGLHLNRQRRAANDDLSGDGGDRLDRAGDLGLVLGAELSEDALRARQHLAGLDALPFFLEHAVGHVVWRHRQQLGQVQRRDVAGHERLGDDLPRLDTIARLHEHVAGNWQQAARAV